MDRYRERTEHAELLVGLIAATAANHSFCPPKKPVAPSDFMPSQWAKRKPRKKPINRKAIAQNIRNLLMARISEQSRVN
jgi:hypothetical protein